MAAGLVEFVIKEEREAYGAGEDGGSSEQHQPARRLPEIFGEKLQPDQEEQKRKALLQTTRSADDVGNGEEQPLRPRIAMMLLE